MIDKQTLLQRLPPYQDEWITTVEDQRVSDIISEVLEAHKLNARFYDCIALYFDAEDPDEIARTLYEFCKQNFRYVEESEATQKSFTPQGALSEGNIDCKGYAGFIGGCLGGIERATGKRLNWNYRFASYRLFDDTPGHVFVVMNNLGEEIWVDPTPGAETKRPVWEINKKAKVGSMAILRNIAGVEDGIQYEQFNAASRDPLLPNWNRNYYDPNDFFPRSPMTVSGAADDISDIDDKDKAAIQILLNYGVIDAAGNIDYDKLSALPGLVGPSELDILDTAAYKNTVGGWFDDAFKFVQHFAAGMGMQVPRATFLGLVSQNVFGYATKLQRALSFTDTKNKLSDLWERLGGTFSKLESTINSGATKKAVLKGVGSNRVGEVATAVSIIGSAAIIIAAIMPIITKMLSAHNADVQTGVQYDPATGMPIGPGVSGGIGSGLMSWVQQNPVPSLAIAIVVGYAILNYKDL